MKRYSIIVITLCGLLLCASLNAQTLVWQIPPASYDALTYQGNGVFIFEKNGHKGLLRSNGTEMLSAKVDVITGFYEHKALLLADEGAQQRVIGYLTDAAEVVTFKDKYYTLNGLAFYSCGMLPVTDAQGRKGYLNETGNKALGFDEQWTQVLPFSEGYASVYWGMGKDRKYRLIDRNGQSVHFMIGYGEVMGGINVYNGQATIWDEERKFYSFDIQSAKYKKMASPKSLETDYLYCLRSQSNRPKNVPYNTPFSITEGMTPTMETNGLWGYNGMLPAQFAEAAQVLDGMAVVTLKGQRGVLRMADATNVCSLKSMQSEYTYEQGASVKCAIQVTMPEPWMERTTTVELRDASTNTVIPSQWSQGVLTFSMKPSNRTQSVNVMVHGEGLLLCSQTAILQFRKLEPQLTVSISVASDVANKDNQVPVTATIKNNSSFDVKTTVHMTGSSTLVEKHTTLNIPAHGMAQVHSVFVVTKDVSGQSVRVTTSHGGSALRTGLSFESYN